MISGLYFKLILDLLLLLGDVEMIFFEDVSGRMIISLRILKTISIPSHCANSDNLRSYAFKVSVGI